MTPTVARMVAARRRELGFPLRLYAIPNLFRYERPQKGRLREHWQLNVDLFGVSNILADAEIIEIAYRLMKSFGADDSMFQIKVADRALLETAFDACEMTKEQKDAYRRLLDKKAKIPASEFTAAAAEITDRDPIALIEGTDPSVAEAEGVVRGLISMLKERGVSNVVFDPSIVRGFDYYTGTVFEVYDTSGENTRSLFGGGRYDYLVAEYGGEQVPAMGFGMGDVTARDFLETHKLLPHLNPATQLYIAPAGAPEGAAKAADRLREIGINTAVGIKDQKIGDHIKTAEKLSIPDFAVYGSAEEASGIITIKNLKTGETREQSL